MSTESDQFYLQAQSMPFHDDEKQGSVRSSSPCELNERCCRHHREGKGIRRLIKILAVLGVMFIGYKALVRCVRYKFGRHELSEVCVFFFSFFRAMRRF